MKAVVYHAEARVAQKFPPGTYEKLMRGLERNLDAHNIPMIHLTTRGHPIWAREGREYDGDPQDTVWNRDKFFIEFLRNEPDDVYLCIEPDHRVARGVPNLRCDAAVLYRRNSGPHFTPSWRMARKSALPFFEWIFRFYPKDGSKRDWDGDSTAWGTAWEKMGSPTVPGDYKFMGLDIEIRPYEDYTHTDSKMMVQFKATSKMQLVEAEEKAIAQAKAG